MKDIALYEVEVRRSKSAVGKRFTVAETEAQRLISDLYNQAKWLIFQDVNAKWHVYSDRAVSEIQVCRTLS